MTGKQQTVLWLGLAIVIIRLIATDQGPELLSLITAKPFALGKKVNNT
jgi:hypothetical protein